MRRFIMIFLGILASMPGAVERYVFNAVDITTDTIQSYRGDYVFTQGTQVITEYRNGLVIQHPTWAYGKHVAFARFDDCTYYKGNYYVYICPDNLFIVWTNQTSHYYVVK